jgi:ribosomal protein S18 acetylase RimI-like enzyme
MGRKDGTSPTTTTTAIRSEHRRRGGGSPSRGKGRRRALLRFRPNPRQLIQLVAPSIGRLAEVFREPETFLFPRPCTGELVGHALGHIHGSPESWWSDTWRTGERVGELESVFVQPGHRGAGIGSALLDAVDAEFARLGVDDQVMGVLPGNVGAVGMYERRGFRPTWLTCPDSPVATAPRKAWRAFRPA